jgi:hypothetical protein
MRYRRASEEDADDDEPHPGDRDRRQASSSCRRQDRPPRVGCTLGGVLGPALPVVSLAKGGFELCAWDDG